VPAGGRIEAASWAAWCGSSECTRAKQGGGCGARAGCKAVELGRARRWLGLRRMGGGLGGLSGLGNCAVASRRMASWAASGGSIEARSVEVSSDAESLTRGQAGFSRAWAGISRSEVQL
jgi:hypothetical protein